MPMSVEVFYERLVEINQKTGLNKKYPNEFSKICLSWFCVCAIKTQFNLPASIITKLWEGLVPADQNIVDDSYFLQAASNGNWSPDYKIPSPQKCLKLEESWKKSIICNPSDVNMNKSAVISFHPFIPLEILK
jgi:hypothetical protein